MGAFISETPDRLSIISPAILIIPKVKLLERLSFGTLVAFLMKINNTDFIKIYINKLKLIKVGTETS